MPRLSSFVPAHTGTGTFTELAMQIYGHLDINLDTIDDCNIAHLYQFLKKNDLDPLPELDDDALIEDYARPFLDYANIRRKSPLH